MRAFLGGITPCLTEELQTVSLSKTFADSFQDQKTPGKDLIFELIQVGIHSSKPDANVDELPNNQKGEL